MKSFTFTRWLLPGLVSVALGVAASGPELGAQELDSIPTASRAPSRPIDPDFGRIAVLDRPGAPLVGLGLVVEGGSAADRPGREGERWLWTHLLAQRLESAAPIGRGRSTETEVFPDRLVVRLLVEPADLEQALSDLRQALRTPPDPATFERLRARVLSTLVFEGASPVVEMEAERRSLTDGLGTPWSRPGRGTRNSIERLSPADLIAVGESLVREDIGLGVVGAIGPDTDWLPSAVSGVESSRAPEDPTAVFGPPPWGGSTTWSTGDRVRVIREVTNSWITVAFPVPEDVPATLLDFLAHRIHEDIAATPPDPGLFDAEVRVLRRPSGRILMLHVAVLPEATERFESRLVRAPATASEPVQPDFFSWLRRRFRAGVMLREAAPEVIAQRAAEDLLRDGAIRDIANESWALSAELLAATAAALGPPRVMVFGPSIAEGG